MTVDPTSRGSDNPLAVRSGIVLTKFRCLRPKRGWVGKVDVVQKTTRPELHELNREGGAAEVEREIFATDSGRCFKQPQ